MRYLVISDVHSNFPALQSVLMDAPDHDEVLCLGDLVGYGPNPNECVDRVRDLALTCIAGNHDWGAIGQADLSVFNRDARRALIWTQNQMAPSVRSFLEGLEPRLDMEGPLLLSHGSPRDPIWEYMVDVGTATVNFRRFDFQVGLVGHSHVPTIFEMPDPNARARLLSADLAEPLDLAGRRLILNPGSVGQPRDRDPRASYAMLDTDAMTWTFRRVEYPVEITQERMRAADLPVRLINRLSIGR
jgi:diadenosine tetraphosphatase ApaH/serine/threonine PP2A family protein phosphatase